MIQYTKPFLLLLLIQLTVFSVYAQSNKVTAWNQQRATRIDSLLLRHIHEQHIPGATALIIRNGQVVYNKAFGYADVAARQPMKTNNIFRIASQSKAITSLAVMMLWEQGRFLLDDPVSMYLPAFANPRVLVTFNEKDSSYTTRPAKREITIRDLLRHTSGIAYAAVFSDKTMQAIYTKAGIPSGIGTTNGMLKEKMALLAAQPLQHDPGAAFTYGLNTDLLGHLIEVWSGERPDSFMHRHIFAPLEMNDTYFHLPAAKQQRLVSLYENKGAVLVKVDHPIYEGADPLFPNLNGTYLSGGAGLSSTTADYARFLSLYLHKGRYKDKQFVSAATIDLMLANQLSPDLPISPDPAQPTPFAFGLSGFALETPANDHLLPLNIGSFGWGGAFNTHGWADPKEGLIGLLFTQEYLSPWWRIGDEFKVLTYQALQ
ncbi:MAG: beta-lactamase family protein [Niastella sp.]|nr:beta-lactamase family protein [Niastella sp.]